MRLVNLGEEFFFMDLLEQVNHIWLKPVQLSAKVLSFQSVLQILWVNGWVNQNVSSSNFLRWLVKRNLLSFSLMRLILFVVAEVKVKMILLAELKPSSLSKCKVWAMIWMVSLYLVQQTYLGNLIMLLDVDSKSVFTFHFQMQMLDQVFSKYVPVKLKMI